MFLFCNGLEGSTKSEDIMEKINTFLWDWRIKVEKRLWGLYGWCTIYAWVKIWLSEKSKRSSSPIKGNPLHDSPLCPCQQDSSETLNSIIKIVNCIKSGALNTRLFKVKNCAKTWILITRSFLSILQYAGCRKEMWIASLSWKMKSSCSWKCKGNKTFWYTLTTKSGWRD